MLIHAIPPHFASLRRGVRPRAFYSLIVRLTKFGVSLTCLRLCRGLTTRRPQGSSSALAPIRRSLGLYCTSRLRNCPSALLPSGSLSSCHYLTFPKSAAGRVHFRHVGSMLHTGAAQLFCYGVRLLRSRLYPRTRSFLFFRSRTSPLSLGVRSPKGTSSSLITHVASQPGTGFGPLVPQLRYVSCTCLAHAQAQSLELKEILLLDQGIAHLVDISLVCSPFACASIVISPTATAAV